MFSLPIWHSLTSMSPLLRQTNSSALPFVLICSCHIWLLFNIYKYEKNETRLKAENISSIRRLRWTEVNKKHIPLLTFHVLLYHFLSSTMFSVYISSHFIHSTELLYTKDLISFLRLLFLVKRHKLQNVHFHLKF